MSGVSSAASGAIIEFANPVQSIGTLRAIPAAHRLDKQARLVEDKGAIYYFDVQGTGADNGDTILKPTDVALANPGRWFKTLGAAGSASVTFSTVSALQAMAANSEDIVHGLGKQAIVLTVMIMPPSGTYQDVWVGGEGTITVVYLDANTVRLYNESDVELAAGRVRIVVVG